MNRNFIGFDIRRNGIFAVLLKSGFKKSTMDSFLYQPFNDPLNHAESLPLALEAISEHMDLGGSSCLVSIASNEFSYRNLTVPFHQPKKILQVLPYELEPTLPIPVENLAIDFQKISFPQDEEKTAVIASTVPIEWIKRYIDTIESYGITVEGIVPAGYPLALQLNKQLASTTKGWLVIDLCDELFTIIILREGQINLIRSIPITSEPEILPSNITTHLQRTFAGFESLYNSPPDIDRIYLSGPGLKDDTFVQRLQQELQRAFVPTLVADITLDNELTPKAEEPSNAAWQPTQFSPALAAALVASNSYIGINFRKGELAPKSGLGEHKDGLVKFAIAAGVVFIFFIAGLIIETSMLEKRANRLQDEMVQVFRSTFPEAKKIIKQAVSDQMLTRINEAKKTALVPSGPDIKMRPIDILRNISHGIPSGLDIKLTKLVAGDQGILISGTTDSFNSVDELKTRLENIDGFESVKINSANMDRSGDRVRYKLKIQ
jgi:general secretion pathway protein L